MRAGLAPEAEEDALTRQLYGNPVAWGVTLVTLGIVFLMHTLLGFQFPVKRTLPVALVVLGAYMLYDYLKRRRRREELRGFTTATPPPSVVASWPMQSARFDTGDLPTRVGRQYGSAGLK
jgi:hypothetical protein